MTQEMACPEVESCVANVTTWVGVVVELVTSQIPVLVAAKRRFPEDVEPVNESSERTSSPIPVTHSRDPSRTRSPYSAGIML
jgi:hypothetical protein